MVNSLSLAVARTNPVLPADTVAVRAYAANPFTFNVTLTGADTFAGITSVRMQIREYPYPAANGAALADITHISPTGTTSSFAFTAAQFNQSTVHPSKTYWVILTALDPDRGMLVLWRARLILHPHYASETTADPPTVTTKLTIEEADTIYATLASVAALDVRIDALEAAPGISNGDKGDITVTASGATWTVDNDVVTNAKAANMATATIKGRTTAGTGDPEDLTVTQAKTLMALENVTNTSDANKPVSTAQQTALNLKADLTNAVQDMTAATFTAETITSTDVLAAADLQLNGGFLSYGTATFYYLGGAATAHRTALGLGTLATQSITFGTGVASSLAVNVGSAGAPVLYNGAGGTPSSIVLTNGTGYLTSALSGTITNAQLAGSIDLTTKVSGALPIANGGTNAITAAAARNSLSVPGLADDNAMTGGQTFSKAGAASVSPVLLTGSVFVGGTGTTNLPYLYLNHGNSAPTTWGTSGTVMGINAPSSFAGNLIDLHVNGGASVFSVTSSGAVSTPTSVSAPLYYGTAGSNGILRMDGNTSARGLGIGSLHQIAWQSGSYSGGTVSGDLMLQRKAAANLRQGDADAAAAVAQTSSVQSVVAGTSNIAGANRTYSGSQGTGSGVGGGHIFQVAPSGAAATVQNTLVDALTITGKGGINLYTTTTAGGTTGNVTIDKPSGTVNIAAAGTTVTVTNILVSATSTVFAVIRTNDTTALIKNVVPGAGSFVINLNASTTAETSIGFLVINP